MAAPAPEAAALAAGYEAVCGATRAADPTAGSRQDFRESL